MQWGSVHVQCDEGVAYIALVVAGRGAGPKRHLPRPRGQERRALLPRPAAIRVASRERVVATGKCQRDGRAKGPRETAARDGRAPGIYYMPAPSPRPRGTQQPSRELPVDWMEARVTCEETAQLICEETAQLITAARAHVRFRSRTFTQNSTRENEICFDS